MNPRIQVEHTVTEEVTGIDLVLSQLRIARGETLADLGLAQEGISVQRSAIQCRITTEDPADDFRPDTGTIVVYRSPGGPGVRLDGGTYAGAEVTPFFDSLLVKLTDERRRLHQRRPARASGAGGVPGPRCRHQHPLPAGRARATPTSWPASSPRPSSTSIPS